MDTPRSIYVRTVSNGYIVDFYTTNMVENSEVTVFNRLPDLLKYLETYYLEFERKRNGCVKGQGYLCA
jgi:hypothetical protein